MVRVETQSDLSRSPSSLGAIVTSAGLEAREQPLQVAEVLRGLQARASTVGSFVTLAVDDTVHLQIDEALLSSTLASLLDYGAEHGAETFVLRLSSEEPGVVLELEIDDPRLASKMWQELQSSAPHSSALARAARAFQEMQAKLELQHTSETNASLVILFPVQHVGCGVAAE